MLCFLLLRNCCGWCAELESSSDAEFADAGCSCSGAASALADPAGLVCDAAPTVNISFGPVPLHLVTGVKLSGESPPDTVSILYTDGSGVERAFNFHTTEVFYPSKVV